MKAELEQLQKENDAILVSGKPARAIIKKLTPLGVNVNGNNPYVELELEVLPEIMPAFAASQLIKKRSQTRVDLPTAGRLEGLRQKS